MLSREYVERALASLRQLVATLEAEPGEAVRRFYLLAVITNDDEARECREMSASDLWAIADPEVRHLAEVHTEYMRELVARFGRALQYMDSTGATAVKPSDFDLPINPVVSTEANDNAACKLAGLN